MQIKNKFPKLNDKELTMETAKRLYCGDPQALALLSQIKQINNIRIK